MGENRILSIGTIEGTLRELNPNSLLVSCDRPALFYIASGRLEMQYLREDIVNQANLVDVHIKDQEDKMDTGEDGQPSNKYEMLAYVNT